MIRYVTQSDGTFTKSGDLIKGAGAVQIVIEKPEGNTEPFGDYTLESAQELVESAYAQGKAKASGYQIVSKRDSTSEAVESKEDSKTVPTSQNETNEEPFEPELPEPVPVAKPKRVLTPEHLAKLKAGRIARRKLEKNGGDWLQKITPTMVLCEKCGASFARPRGRYPGKICGTCKIQPQIRLSAK